MQLAKSLFQPRSKKDSAVGLKCTGRPGTGQHRVPQ
ncbi:hypothetical protein ACTNEY_05485 [Fusicatenibacter saccharivorans]